jgi:zinc/manganese transport system permease protein
MHELTLPGEVPFSLLWPALWASGLVIATHLPLGAQVLARGIIFIDLAIAQVASLGAYLVLTIAGEQAPAYWIQVGAVSLSLCAAWGLVALERLGTRLQEPIIGVVFILAATAILLLAHGNPHGGQQLSDLLSGQILWVSSEQLKYSSAVTLLVLIGLSVFRERRWAFYSLFAIAITVSVQLVGVYLVFATLIIPALACSTMRSRRKWLITSLVAIAGYIAGIFFSAWLDLPTGPLIVWMLAVTGILVRLNHVRQLMRLARQMPIR